MTDREASRTERIIEAAESGNLDDVAVFQMLSASRAEGASDERNRISLLLERRALECVRRGDRETAEFLTEIVESLSLPSPAVTRTAEVVEA